MGTEERNFQSKLRVAREFRDRKRREKELAMENGRMENDRMENGRMEEAAHQMLSEELEEAEDENLGFVNTSEQVTNGKEEDGRRSQDSLTEWDDLQRKTLLELGLAVEWNLDNSEVAGQKEEEGGGEGEFQEDVPVIMGLKLLPVIPTLDRDAANEDNMLDTLFQLHED